MKVEIKAIYLNVFDMNRAVEFYEKVFNCKVSSKSERMSSFDFENISFLLFNSASDNEKVIIGNNVVVNIEVDNIEKMRNFTQKEKCSTVMNLEEIDGYLIFQVRDTEDNIIEFYQVTE